MYRYTAWINTATDDEGEPFVLTIHDNEGVLTVDGDRSLRPFVLGPLEIGVRSGSDAYESAKEAKSAAETLLTGHGWSVCLTDEAGDAIGDGDDGWEMSGGLVATVMRIAETAHTAG